MYKPQAHSSQFTHSMRLDRLPSRFQDLVQDWSKHLPPEERLQYFDGEFFLVVPFEMLAEDAITLADLSAFTRRFNRLHEVENYEGLEAHLASYPFKGWTRHAVQIDDYLEMMFFLHHLKDNLTAELAKPATLAIFIHD